MLSVLQDSDVAFGYAGGREWEWEEPNNFFSRGDALPTTSTCRFDPISILVHE